jgi:hypothetical protein
MVEDEEIASPTIRIANTGHHLTSKLLPPLGYEENSELTVM